MYILLSDKCLEPSCDFFISTRVLWLILTIISKMIPRHASMHYSFLSVWLPSTIWKPSDSNVFGLQVVRSAKGKMALILPIHHTQRAFCNSRGRKNPFTDLLLVQFINNKPSLTQWLSWGRVRVANKSCSSPKSTKNNSAVPKLFITVGLRGVILPFPLITVISGGLLSRGSEWRGYFRPYFLINRAVLMFRRHFTQQGHVEDLLRSPPAGSISHTYAHTLHLLLTSGALKCASFMWVAQWITPDWVALFYIQRAVKHLSRLTPVQEIY